MEPLEIMGALLTTEGRDDPYPLYDQAHRLGSVIDAADGFVMVPSYDQCNQVLRNASFGVWDVEWRGRVWDDEQQRRPSLRSMERSVIYTNAPDHGRMRSLISSVFTPRRVAALEPAIERAVEALLDRLAEAGADGAAVDLMDDFAYRLPVSVICDLLGIPPADRETFRVLATELAAVLDFVDDLSRLDGADAAWLELELYFGGLLAERRMRPQDDLVSALIAVCDADDSRLSAAELLCNLALLLIAGFETTANLFGNGVRLLFEHPEVGAGLRNGDLRYAGFAEEVLRYDSPVQMTTRIALTDGLSVGDVPAPAGTEVAVMIGAANRDARRYEDPERFDPTRTEIGPLSFGAGPHFCVGSILARTEAAIGFPRLLARFPALAPAGEPTRNQRFILRGYERLPVTVT
ncbi:cytochrome P450 [Catenulispora sp. GP43]|uniref:cytochrome P450 n=1 Tax=Catenulispora sp. GP43 TaxID=3156263 RepID=UPI00351118ED